VKEEQFMKLTHKIFTKLKSAGIIQKGKAGMILKRENRKDSDSSLIQGT